LRLRHNVLATAHARALRTTERPTRKKPETTLVTKSRDTEGQRAPVNPGVFDDSTVEVPQCAGTGLALAPPHCRSGRHARRRSSAGDNPL